MNEVKAQEAKPQQEKATYQVRSMVATELPAERTYPLSSDEFQTLCDGESSRANSGMWGCIGLLAGGLIGMFSLFENADWSSFWTQRRGMLLVYFGVLLAMSAGALVGFVVCLFKMRKEDTSYSRLKRRVEKHFTAAPGPSPSEPTQDDSCANISVEGS